MASISPPTARYRVLDFYRYIAAAAVAVYHLREIGEGEPIARLLTGGFGYCVDFFFILSGFIISHVYGTSVRTGRDYAEFQGKRLARVYPLHLATLLVFAGLTLVETGLGNGFVRHFLTNLGLVHAWGIEPALYFNTPSWSISAEFFCYLLFPFLAPAFMRLPLPALMAVLVVAYAALRSPYARFFTSGLNGANFDFGMIRALIFFAFGMGIHRAMQVIPYRASWLLGVGALAFAGAFASMIFWRKPDLVILCCVIAIMATAMGEEARGFDVPGGRILGFLGDLSYALYMIHMVLIVVLLKPLWPLAKGAGVSLTAYILLSIVFISAVAYPVYRGLESPARRHLTRAVHRLTRG